MSGASSPQLVMILLWSGIAVGARSDNCHLEVGNQRLAFPRHYGKIVCGTYHAHRDQFPVDLQVLTFTPYATQHHMRKL